MKKITALVLCFALTAYMGVQPLSGEKIYEEKAGAASVTAKGKITVTVINGETNLPFTSKNGSFGIVGSPAGMAEGAAGAIYLGGFKAAEKSSCTFEDVQTNFSYIVQYSDSDYDGFSYSIDHEKCNPTIKFTDSSEVNVTIYMKKYVWREQTEIPGDVNSDGAVNAADLAGFQKWMNGSSDIASEENADFNQDGKVNIVDFCLLKNRILHVSENQIQPILRINERFKDTNDPVYHIISEDGFRFLAHPVFFKPGATIYDEYNVYFTEEKDLLIKDEEVLNYISEISKKGSEYLNCEMTTFDYVSDGFCDLNIELVFFNESNDLKEMTICSINNGQVKWSNSEDLQNLVKMLIESGYIEAPDFWNHPDENPVRMVIIEDETNKKAITAEHKDEIFYEDENYRYIFGSVKSKYVKCYFSDGSVMNISEALKNGLVFIRDLDNYNIKFMKEEKENPEIHTLTAVVQKNISNDMLQVRKVREKSDAFLPDILYINYDLSEISVKYGDTIEIDYTGTYLQTYPGQVHCREIRVLQTDY